MRGWAKNWLDICIMRGREIQTPFLLYPSQGDSCPLKPLSGRFALWRNWAREARENKARMSGIEESGWKWKLSASLSFDDESSYSSLSSQKTGSEAYYNFGEKTSRFYFGERIFKDPHMQTCMCVYVCRGILQWNFST